MDRSSSHLDSSSHPVSRKASSKLGVRRHSNSNLDEDHAPLVRTSEPHAVHGMVMFGGGHCGSAYGATIAEGEGHYTTRKTSSHIGSTHAEAGGSTVHGSDLDAPIAVGSAHNGRPINDESETEIEIFVYRRRWVVLAIFVATLFINQAQYTAYVTIVDETRSFYNISALQVNSLAIIYTAVNVVMIVFVCYFYDKVGFRNGVLLVGVMNCLCAGFKFISVFSPHFAWLVVGQICGGCSQVLAISIPPLLAALWFPVNERSLATAVGSVSGNLGVAFSFWAAPLVLNGTADKDHFLILMSIYFGAAIVTLLLSLLFVSNEPPKPPSVTARTHDTFGATSFVDLLKLFWKQATNWSLVRLCLGFGICVGLGTALSNVLAQIYKPFGVDGQSIGIIGAASIVAACLTTPGAALLLDKYRAYKHMLLLIYLASGVVLGVLAAIMWANVPHMLPALYILIIGYQVVSQPSVPLMMEFSVEKTYPDPEFISSSFCLLVFSLFATFGGLGFSALLGDNPTQMDGVWCIGGNAILALVAIAVTATVSQERLRYEEEQRIYKSARVSQYNVSHDAPQSP